LFETVKTQFFFLSVEIEGDHWADQVNYSSSFMEAEFVVIFRVVGLIARAEEMNML